MNYSEIFLEIDKIRSILKRWESSNSVDAIERDLILDKLKKLYDSVLFADGVVPTQEAVVESLPKVAFAPIDLSIDLFEQETVPAELEVAELEAEVEEERLGEVEAEVDEVEAKFELELEAEAEIAEVEEERLDEVEATVEEEAEVASELAADVESISVAHISDQSLFGEDAMPVKRKIDRRVILSLYGDDPVEEIAAVEKAVGQMEANSTTEAFPAIESTLDEPTIESTLDEPTIKHAPGAILGEVMGQGHHTFGEVMSAVQDKKDIATKVASANTTSLRKIIGINDKFLMIRDIFGGDAAAYEQTISTLETFNSLDTALIHIHESYDWNSNSEGVKLLIELLTRKLS